MDAIIDLHRMEGQGVHWPYMVNAINSLAMALKSRISLLAPPVKGRNAQQTLCPRSMPLRILE